MAAFPYIMEYILTAHFRNASKERFSDTDVTAFTQFQNSVMNYYCAQNVVEIRIADQPHIEVFLSYALGDRGEANGKINSAVSQLSGLAEECKISSAPFHVVSSRLVRKDIYDAELEMRVKQKR